MKVLLVSCCLLAIGLAGCGDPNAGDQEVADFRAWLDEHPGDGLRVESRSSLNALPWVGDGEVTLRVEEPLGLVTAAEHVCDYNLEHASGAVDFVAQVGVVVAPFGCGDDDLPELEGRVQELNAVRGLRFAGIGADGVVEASFRERWQLIDAYPSLSADHAAATARTDGLDVVDSVFADEDVRAALSAHVAELSPLVSQIAARTRSGDRPGGISVVTVGRPDRVRRQMEALTPGVPITVVSS